MFVLDEFFDQLSKYIHELKERIFKENKDKDAIKLLPLMHMVLYLITYHKYKDQSNLLEELGNQTHELRMLPVPFGLLAHELIEVVDCERILPGMTRISKLAEDFPLIDHHSILKERATNFTNVHQNVFVYADPFSTVRRILNVLPSSSTELINKFKTYNDIRYSFICNLFTQYNMGKEDDKYFHDHLKRIQSSYIWNIYK